MKLSLNRNQLKMIAIAAMLIDHIAWAFLSLSSPLSQLMHLIGRLTGPLMAYFLYEGYLHTRNLKKYMLRLAVFALISWIPFSLFAEGTWPSSRMGVIYTLFWALAALYVWDKLEISLRPKLVLIVLICLFSIIGDWPIMDVIIPLSLFIYRDNPDEQMKRFQVILLYIGIAFTIASVPLTEGLYNLGVLLVYPLIRYTYNGESGSRSAFHKWFFYIFYPSHLLVLYAVKNLITG